MTIMTKPAITPAPMPRLVWNPSPNFSARSAHVDLIVIHDCQGGYQGSVGTFKGGGAGSGPVSAHYVLKEDGSEATQMVALDKKAWHCRNFNSRSVGIEMAGFEANTTRATTLTHKDTYVPGEWSAAAVMTAYLCHHLKIPARWASGGVGPGIARHLDLGASGGGHTDPTRDPAVWQHFISLVQSALAMHTFPDVWEPAPRSSLRPDGIATRIDRQCMSPAEIAITDAMSSVEKTGASTSLTKATIALAEARNHVADHVEGLTDKPATPAAVAPASLIAADQKDPDMNPLSILLELFGGVAGKLNAASAVATVAPAVVSGAISSVSDIPTVVKEIEALIADVKGNKWSDVPNAAEALLAEFTKILGNFGVKLPALTSMVDSMVKPATTAGATIAKAA